MVATSVSTEDTRHPAAVDSEQRRRGSEALSVRTERQLSHDIPVEDRCLLTLRGVGQPAPVASVSWEAPLASLILLITSRLLLKAFLKACHE